jgi:hypothetical protein
MGQRFTEGTIPAVLGQIKRLNENLERLNENLEKTLNQEADDKSDECDE